MTDNNANGNAAAADVKPTQNGENDGGEPTPGNQESKPLPQESEEKQPTAEADLNETSAKTENEEQQQPEAAATTTTATDEQPTGTDEKPTGADEQPTTTTDGQPTDDAAAGNLAGLGSAIAKALENLFEKSGMKSEELDTRAIELIRSFPEDHACYVIDALTKFKLRGVVNRQQYLMAIMRTFRDRVRAVGPQVSLSQPVVTAPTDDALTALIERTGYKVEVTVGQRKYGGPPPDWTGEPTGPKGSGYEVYIGHVPHEWFETDLVPLFEECGKIWDLRLMMDPQTARNRGYAFLTYCEKDAAKVAAKKGKYDSKR